MSRRIALLLVTMALVVLATSTFAQAQPPDGFLPRTEVTQTEQLSAGPLIYTAYAFVWVALIAYVFLLWRRLTRVERELADVLQRLSTRR